MKFSLEPFFHPGIVRPKQYLRLTELESGLCRYVLARSNLLFLRLWIAKLELKLMVIKTAKFKKMNEI